MRRWVLPTLGAIVAIFIVVPVVLRVFFFSPYRIPSASMEPTFPVGVTFFVSKRSTPARGEVAVFRYPEDPNQEFIKRVIAFPGETVEVVGGKITINGWSVPSCALGPFTYDEMDGTHHSGTLEVEFLGDVSYLVFFDATGVSAHEGPWTVKPHEAWVMGDNRYNSHDSRQWFGGLGGGVPEANVEGKALAGNQASLPASSPNAAKLAACLAARPSKTVP